MIFVNNFSLGLEFADNYYTFDATPKKTSSKKKRSGRLPISMDGRKTACIEFAELIMNCTSRIMYNLFSVMRLDKMWKFREQFLFIQILLNRYANYCGSIQHNYFRIGLVYKPLLLAMRRDEVSNLIYDIFKLAEGFKHFMRRSSKLSVRDTDCINSLVRVLFAFGEYFRSVISRNPEFKDERKKSQEIWKRKDLRL